MRPAHRLHREKQRLTACVVLADRYGNPMLSNHAGQVLARLRGLPKTLPADAGYLAGVIGRNGMGPQLDDIARSVRVSRRRHEAPAARRAQQNRDMLDQITVDRAVSKQPHAFAARRASAGWDEGKALERIG